MLYKLKNNAFITKTDSFSYIKTVGIYNEITLDSNGSIFLGCITRVPQTLEELTDKLNGIYINVSADILKNDMKEFLNNLVLGGFIAKGETIDEVEKDAIGFEYSRINPVSGDEYVSVDNETKDSAFSMRRYFDENPKILSFQFEITNKCNERCVHCYIPHKFKNIGIDDDVFYRTLNELKEMNAPSITLSGGEPMVHPHFKDYLKKAKEMGFEVVVLSNLLLIDDEIIELLKYKTLSCVQVSLYSTDPEIHDSVTTIKGSCEKTKNAIDRLIENEIPVTVSCPVMKQNRDSFKDVKEWAFKRKIKAQFDFSIMAQYNHEKGNLDNRLNLEETRKNVIDSLTFSDAYRKRILNGTLKDYEGCPKNPTEALCGAGITKLCMAANGDIVPCSSWQGMVCGNVNESSLTEIWNNSKELKWVQSLRRKDLPKCLDCKFNAFCSPCIARFANESKTGNPLEIAEHFCKVAEVTKETIIDFYKKEKCI